MAHSQTPIEVVVHNFIQPSGYYPAAGLTRDAAGNLYGTTVYGGTANRGVVYKLDNAGYTVLYSFPGGAAGSGPYAGVVRDAAGNLYGSTIYGGGADAGVVYKLDTAGQETVLHGFGGGEGGSEPTGVVLDAAGNLYGATTSGGTAGAGFVYKVDTAGGYSFLHNFAGRPDGAHPKAGLVLDSAGNLYGTTNAGGTDGHGTVYMLDTTGHETVLYSFTGRADGSGPESGVILDSAGNLYGTTIGGGSGNAGVVYKLDTSGQETVLYSFTGGAGGGQPFAGVILDAAGNLYGTTQFGGTDGQGVVYQVSPDGQETVLHSFTGGADGGSPVASVTFGPKDDLYGTAENGGANGDGAIFKVTPR
jgi:uncharacterized repeat protein (TIGR03803 family)